MRSLILVFAAAVASHAQWLDYRTPGIPRTASGKANLTAPAPKADGGKPDLSGVWITNPEYFFDLAKDLKPEDVPMLPWALALQKEREANDHKSDPLAQCMPPGVPRIDTSNNGEALHPMKIVQTRSLVVLLYETSANSTFRQIFLDGRPLPKDPQPTWLGYSVGKWEGNSLVAETTGFNGRAWLDTRKGRPQSEDARVTERFTRRDFGHMTLGITIDDPKAYGKPWSVELPYTLLPDTELIETYCENEKDQAHAVAK
ncbi:MAG TPA: hypothetical protein VH639_02620 [Bryobacteraceae bacterium]